MRIGLIGTAIIVLALAGAALLTFLLGVSLSVPGTGLESLWNLNPSARSAFGSSALAASAALFALSATCAATAAGLLFSKPWAWWLSVALFALVFLFNLLRLFSGDRGEYFGTPFTGALLLLHFLPGVRRGASPKETP